MTIRQIILMLIILFLVFGLFLHWGMAFFLLPVPAAIGIPPQVIKKMANKEHLSDQRLESGYAFFRNSIKAVYLAGNPVLRGITFYVFCESEDGFVGKYFDKNIFSGNAFEKYFQSRLALMISRKMTGYFSNELLSEVAGYFWAKSENSWDKNMQYNKFIMMQNLPEKPDSYREEPAIYGTGFGLSSKWTEKENVILAGNIDFKNSDELEGAKTVLLMTPEKGFRYISVGLPGQFGVLAGMNEKGIGLMLLPAYGGKYDGTVFSGTLLAREVMIESDSISRAVEILKGKDIDSAITFLVGSGDENRFVAVEKKPGRNEIRHMKFGVLTAGSYFRSESFTENDMEKRKEFARAHRKKIERIRELIYLNRDQLSFAKIAEILQDHKALHGADLSLGHPFAINSMQTLYSVIFDLKQRVLWIRGPHYDSIIYTAFALNDFSRPLNEMDINISSAHKKEEYENYMKYVSGLDEAYCLYGNSFYQEALAVIQETMHFNPGDYKLHWLAGKALAKINRLDEALYNLYQARKNQPGSYQEQSEIEALISVLENTGKNIKMR